MLARRRGQGPYLCVLVWLQSHPGNHCGMEGRTPRLRLEAPDYSPGIRSTPGSVPVNGLTSDAQHRPVETLMISASCWGFSPSFFPSSMTSLVAVSLEEYVLVIPTRLQSWRFLAAGFIRQLSSDQFSPRLTHLFANFAASPEPSSPQCKTRLPRKERTLWLRSNASLLPPTIMVKVASLAPTAPRTVSLGSFVDVFGNLSHLLTPAHQSSQPL
jgi:hypothetical protein